MAKEEKEYGINELAEEMGILPASVRVALRKANVKKNEGRYRWKTKDEMRKVADKLSTVTSSPKKPAVKAKRVTRKAA